MIIPARAVQDNDGHWYVIKNSMLESFLVNLEDQEMIDSGKFDEMYAKYATGGDLNNTQLFADIEIE